MEEKNILEEFDQKIGSTEELETILNRINNDIEKFEQDKENFEIDKITAENRAIMNSIDLNNLKSEVNDLDISSELENKRKQAEAVTRLIEIRDEISKIKDATEETEISDEEDISKYIEAGENANNQINDLMTEADNILKNLNNLINELDKLQGKKIEHKDAMWKLKERYSIIKDADLKSEMKLYITQDDIEYYISDEGYVYKLDTETETLVYDDEKTIDYVLEGGMSEVEIEPEIEAEAELELDPQLRHKMIMNGSSGYIANGKNVMKERYVDSEDKVYVYKNIDGEETFKYDENETKKYRERLERIKGRKDGEKATDTEQKKTSANPSTTQQSKIIRKEQPNSGEKPTNCLSLIPTDSCMILPVEFPSIDDLKERITHKHFFTRLLSKIPIPSIREFANNRISKLIGKEINNARKKAETLLKEGKEVICYRKDLLSENEDEFFEKYDPEVKMKDELLESFYNIRALYTFEENPDKYRCNQEDLFDGIIPITEQQSKSKKDDRSSWKDTLKVNQSKDRIKDNKGKSEEKQSDMERY